VEGKGEEKEKGECAEGPAPQYFGPEPPLPPVGSGAKPQPTNDLVHRPTADKKCSSGGSSFCAENYICS